MENTIRKGEMEHDDDNELDPGAIVDRYLRENPIPDEVTPISDEKLVPQSVPEEETIPEPAEEINYEPDQVEESSLQPMDESGLSTPLPGDDLPQPAEETTYEPYQEEGSLLQSNEETGINSTFTPEDIPQTAEEMSYEPEQLEENPFISFEESGLDTTTSADELPQPAEDIMDESSTPFETTAQPEEEPGLMNTPLEQDYLQYIQESTPAATSSNESTSTQVTDLLTFTQDVVQEPKPKKIALILSGGGARGAFQVGAEKYARDVKGYHWDIIAGVSVGALNGAMLAMHRYTRLMEIWDSISGSQVYTGGFNLISLVKLMFGAKSFYGNAPLQKLMQREFEAGRIIDDLHVGVVSLINGDYMQFTKESLELVKAILASASIPVVWPPVDIAPDRLAMVDGGVRNISPVGDVLDLEPDEIVIINCSAEQPPVMPGAAANVLSIGMRALDIMQNEIFVNDMKEFLRINALVQEAEKQGCLLHNPKTGKLFKYYPCQVIQPDIELGEVLDFSQSSIQAALKAGVRRAREVLGRP